MESSDCGPRQRPSASAGRVSLRATGVAGCVWPGGRCEGVRAREAASRMPAGPVSRDGARQCRTRGEDRLGGWAASRALDEREASANATWGSMRSEAGYVDFARRRRDREVERPVVASAAEVRGLASTGLTPYARRRRLRGARGRNRGRRARVATGPRPSSRVTRPHGQQPLPPRFGTWYAAAHEDGVEGTGAPARRLARVGRDRVRTHCRDGAGRAALVGWLRAQRPAHCARQRRHPAARAHPLADQRGPPAAAAVRLAADPLRLPADHAGEHRAGPGEAHDDWRLPRRGVQRQRRPAALEANDALRAAPARLGAELLAGAELHRKAVDPRRRRHALRSHEHRRAWTGAQAAGRVLRLRRLPTRPARVSHQRVHQHADHGRRRGERVLRIPGHRSDTDGAPERHRPRRRRRGRKLGRRVDCLRRSGDHEGGAQRRAGAEQRRQHALRRRERRQRHRLRRPATCSPSTATASRPSPSGDSGIRSASRTPPYPRTARRRPPSDRTATSTSASWRIRSGSNHVRGWLLHFDAGLQPRGAPGAFGWDDTASIVPASIVAVVSRLVRLPADDEVQQLRRRRAETASTRSRCSTRTVRWSTRSRARR